MAGAGWSANSDRRGGCVQIFHFTLPFLVIGTHAGFSERRRNQPLAAGRKCRRIKRLRQEYRVFTADLR